MRERVGTDPLICYPTGFKCCRTCKQTLPLLSFWKARKDKPWLHPNCKVCDRTAHRHYIKEHPEKRKQYWKQSHTRIKELIFAQYDNRCNHCGHKDPRVLQIDHIYGGGRKERSKLKPWGSRVRVLKHPEDYQLLCANCHVLKTLGVKC